jgi:hypothetical protein
MTHAGCISRRDSMPFEAPAVAYRRSFFVFRHVGSGFIQRSIGNHMEFSWGAYPAAPPTAPLLLLRAHVAQARCEQAPPGANRAGSFLNRSQDGRNGIHVHLEPQLLLDAFPFDFV